MMMVKRWVVGATLLVIATASGAQTVNYDADYARYRPSEAALGAAQSPALNQCMRRSGGVTVAMRECSSAEYRRMDARLNANYQRVMGRLPQAQQQRLRASQRRWLQTRWNHCDNHPDLEGGTLDLIIRDSCTLDELTRRTLWLGRL